MSATAIHVESLGKAFDVRPAERYRTLRDSLAAWLKGTHPRDAARDRFWALRELSFDVGVGDVLGIVGANGAGKSTLLKILSRITEPTEGLARIRGRVGSLLEVGAGLHPELSGRENIYLYGSILGMKKADMASRFDEIVAFAEVEKFLDTPVKHYSSGMYVRLAFSVAAHLQPEILVIDEVLAVGDMKFQKKCLAKVNDLNGEGRTVLFVSHNLSLVTRLCHRALLLDRGRLAAIGRPAEVVESYLETLRASGAALLPSTARPAGPVELLGAQLVGAGGETTSVADVRDALSIRIDYRVKEPGLAFRCAIVVFAAGTCAFTSVEPAERVHERAGAYRATVAIPAHLLGEGEHFVQVSMFTSHGTKTRYLLVPDCLTFYVVDEMRGDSARGDYSDNLAGAVRPKLPWSAERVA